MKTATYTDIATVLDFEHYKEFVNEFNFKLLCFLSNESETVLIVELKEYNKEGIHLFWDTNDSDLTFVETATTLILNFRF